MCEVQYNIIYDELRLLHLRCVVKNVSRSRDLMTLYSNSFVRSISFLESGFIFHAFSRSRYSCTRTQSYTAPYCVLATGSQPWTGTWSVGTDRAAVGMALDGRVPGVCIPVWSHNIDDINNIVCKQTTCSVLRCKPGTGPTLSLLNSVNCTYSCIQHACGDGDCCV